MKFPPAARLLRRFFLPLLPMALAACSTMNLPDAPKTIGAPPTPNPHYKVGAPYKIDGRWYVPKVDERYDEKGVASWYGDDFQGRLTANGEVFDKGRLSAAHKTLPMPTLVEVENLENGRRVTVRVNDRGPFVDDRIIDLSHAAADALGFAGKGLARVRVRYVGETDIRGLAALPGEAAPAPIRVASKGPARTPTPASTDGDPIAALISSSAGQGTIPAAPQDIWVELAAVEDLDALEAMNLDLPDVGPVSVQSGETAGRSWQSLRIGPFIDEAIAVASLSRVRAAGFGGARIVRSPGL